MMTNQQARAKFEAQEKAGAAPATGRRLRWVSFIEAGIALGELAAIARMWPCPRAAAPAPVKVDGRRNNGGARANAGRKPLEDGLGLTERVKVNLSPLQRDALEEFGGVAWIRQKIDEELVARAKAELIRSALDSGKARTIGEAAAIARKELAL